MKSIAFTTFTASHFYLRRDVDIGWILAIWKWRIFFISRKSK